MKVYRAGYESKYGYIYVDAWFKSAAEAKKVANANLINPGVYSSNVMFEFVIKEKEVTFWEWLFI